MRRVVTLSVWHQGLARARVRRFTTETPPDGGERPAAPAKKQGFWDRMQDSVEDRDRKGAQIATAAGDAPQAPLLFKLEGPIMLQQGKFEKLRTGVWIVVGMCIATTFVVQIFSVANPKSQSNSLLDLFTDASAKQKLGKDSGVGVETRFADVIGLEEAKKEVQDMVEYLKNPELYTEAGLSMPKGMLMFGPPGVGKTLLARAMAGEAGVPIFAVSSTDFEEKFVGVGAGRMRSLFEHARKVAPSILFIDEIDGLGNRSESIGSRSGNLCLTQLLTLMDGFGKEEGVLVIGATNSPEEKLDPAMLRSGRFDMKVHLHQPFVKDRKRLFEYYLTRLETLTPPNLSEVADHLARVSWGVTGADVANIVNQAGIAAVRNKTGRLKLADLQRALADVRMGPENKSMEMTAREKEMTAAHEAGHTIVASFTPGAMPPREVTVVSRKNALGYMVKDAKDHVSTSREALMAELAVAMGGRAAEELVYGPDAITGGAGSDFKQATMIAEQMVATLGFSNHGKMNLEGRNHEFVSEATKANIDKEIGSLLAERYSFALNLLRDKATEHRHLTQELLVRETMTQQEIGKCIGVSWRKE